MGATDHFLAGVSTVATLLTQVSGLIPHAGQLAPVLGVTKELVAIIQQMRDNKDDCSFLAERILRFLEVLNKESTRLNVPIHPGTPTAERISTLIS